MSFAIRKRNPDGTLGDYETVFETPVSEELANAYFALAMQQEQIDELLDWKATMTNEIATLKAEIQALKGGGNP